MTVREARKRARLRFLGFLLPLGITFGFISPITHAEPAQAAVSLPATTVRGSGLYEMARFIGKYSFSADGLSALDENGTLSVVKPANATVEAAYLTAASRISKTPTAPVATLYGASATFTHRSGGADNSSVRNWLADVTSLVKTNIDGALAGTIDIPTVYNAVGTDAYTGLGLTVIFSDPNVEAGTTIFQFGHSNPSGDSTTINFDAISTVPAEAQLSLGISWSIQSTLTSSGANACGYTGETSCIDVRTSSNTNPRRLTSFAGGLDDTEGAVNDGSTVPNWGQAQSSAYWSLVTVGGVGDSAANPSGSWSNYRSDDELYNLASFLAAGDTSLTLSTLNPSGDDSIFQLVLSIPGVLANETVTFNANLGTGSMSSVTRAGAATLPARTFEREGWVFDGWNTAADGSGTDYADQATYPYTSSATLYAQWIAAPGAPSSLTGQAATTDGSVTLSWTAPTNNGSSITGYTIEQRVSGSSTWSAATDSDGNATNSAATISGLGSCEAYDFRVAATNTVGTGSFSPSATVTSFGSTGLASYTPGQFQLIGDATDSDGEITLTQELGNQKGAIWSGARLNLSSSFCIEADVRLSSTANTSGADGVAFVLQPNDTTSLSSGGGLGYYNGVRPSVAVEFDTHPNGAPADSASGQDITLVSLDSSGTADWTAFNQPNYDVTSNSYSLEDGRYHAVRVRYDAGQERFTVLFDLNSDGDFADTGERTVNAISADLSQYFLDLSASDKVYWGFTAATGGSVNLQQVKNIRYSPATLATNNPPTITNPGSQSVAVAASEAIPVTLSDNGETTRAQWRLSAVVRNSNAATATITATSATVATVTVNGLINADTTVTVTAVDADGASATSTFALRVGTGTPAAQQDSSQGQNNLPVTPSVTPNPPRQPRLPLLPTTNPQTLPAPPQTQNPTSGLISQPRALVGGLPAPVTTTQSGNSGLNMQAGSVQLGVLAGGGGSVQQNPQTNQPELRVQSGGSTSFTGGGLYPGSTLQVWLPGATNREMGRLPVALDGSFRGEVSLSQPQGQPPLPIGRQVLQVTGFDANGNQTIVDMPVNIAQGPPTPELNRQLGLIPTLTPGQSLATSAGEPVAVNVIPFQAQNSVTVEGDGWDFIVNVEGGSGEVGGTPESPLIQFTQSGTGSVSGGGFLAETVASVWLFSEPTLLGTVTVAEDGSFTAEFLVDSQFIPAGEHTLQIQGVGEDGYIKAANLGVLIQEPAVATTASSAGTLLWWGLGALLAFVIATTVVMIIARRKRA